MWKVKKKNNNQKFFMTGFSKKFENKKERTYRNIKLFEEKIINQAFLLHSQGNIKEAEKYYKYCIKEKMNDYRVFSNYGLILKNMGKLGEAELLLKKTIQLNPLWSEAHNNLGTIQKDLGKLSEAESSLRKAIKLNPNSANAHSNLGNVLRELKKFKDAEIYLKKAIEIDPKSIIGYANLGNMLKTIGRIEEAKVLLIKTIKINPEFVRPYYSLSRLKYERSDKKWRNYLFSERFLNQKTVKEKINIFFARSNILHQEKKYQDSSINLQIANKLKLSIYPSECELLLKKTKLLFIESEKRKRTNNFQSSYTNSIFIVGMPRCGSTLVESILSVNSDVTDLGEINILESAFTKSRKLNQSISLEECYKQELNKITKEFSITSNKFLYNYQYAGIICGEILNSRIIHCFRNPLDNILSINRANFDTGNYYSSSIVDSTKVYLDQEKIMSIYKDQFRHKIYDLNYDLLVKNPRKEIQLLIDWMGWKWEESYLFPHLNKRAIYTASDIQVRSPINSKSIGGWKQYKEMLKPSIEILTQTTRYRNLLS